MPKLPPKEGLLRCFRSFRLSTGNIEFPLMEDYRLAKLRHSKIIKHGYHPPIKERERRCLVCQVIHLGKVLDYVAGMLLLRS